MEKELDGNYTRMLRAKLNKSWRQHPTKQLYGYLTHITKTSGVLLWTLSHGRAKAGRPAQTYIQQLRADTGCSPEDQPEAMDDREVGERERERGRERERERERERVRDIRADRVA